MKKTTLKRVLIAIGLVGVGVFAVLMFLGRNPVSALNYLSVPFLKPLPPQFLYAIYGEGQKGKFNRPMGIEIADNKIYVTDAGNDRIQVFDMKGKPLFTFGKSGTGKGQVIYPYGMGSDKDYLYVADMHNHRVSLYKFDGTFVKNFAGENGKSPFRLPTNVYVDGNEVFITDVGFHSLFIYGKDGKKIRQIGGKLGAREGQFAYPNAVCVENNQIYVSDTGNNRVQVFDRDGKFIKVLSGSKDPKQTTVVNPRGLVFDPKGLLYVVSPILNQVTVFNEEGDVVFTFGSSGSDNEQFDVANDLAIDQQGRIYVVDKSNNRVVVYGF